MSSHISNEMKGKVHNHVDALVEQTLLTERQATSLIYHEHFGLNYEQIGEVIGITRGAVKDHVDTAKEKWLASEFTSTAGGQFVPLTTSINRRETSPLNRANPNRDASDFSQEVWDFDSIPLPVAQITWEDVRVTHDTKGRLTLYEDPYPDEGVPHWLKHERWVPSDNGKVDVVGGIHHYEWLADIVEEAYTNHDHSCLTECVAFWKLIYDAHSDVDDPSRILSPKTIYEDDYQLREIERLVRFGYLEDWVALELFTDDLSDPHWEAELRDILDIRPKETS